MAKLIKAEFFKLSRSREFLLLLTAALGMGILNGIMPIRRGYSITGYEVYRIMLVPQLSDVILLCIFAAFYVCGEFSSRTFGRTFLCGYARGQVFFAKMIVYFADLFPIILLPIAVVTAIVTAENGFGVEWGAAMAVDVGARLLCYILDGFFKGSFVLLAASIIRDRLGTFGVALAGLYAMILFSGSAAEEQAISWVFILVTVTGAAAMLAAAAYLFVKRELK